MQFDGEREALFVIIRNNRVAEDSVTVHPHADPTRSLHLHRSARQTELYRIRRTAGTGRLL